MKYKSKNHIQIFESSRGILTEVRFFTIEGSVDSFWYQLPELLPKCWPGLTFEDT